MIEHLVRLKAFSNGCSRSVFIAGMLVLRLRSSLLRCHATVTVASMLWHATGRTCTALSHGWQH